VVGGAFSNTATFIDNCGGTATYRFYLTLFNSQPSGIPCTPATVITTDGSQGQALLITAPPRNYYQLNYPGYWLKSDGLGFPNETYVEIVFRTTLATLTQDGSQVYWPSIIDMFPQGRGVTSSGTFPPNDWLEEDFLEVTGANNANPTWGGGAIVWGNYNGPNCGNGQCYAAVPSGQADLTVYHKLGALVTSDGSTNVWKCTFFDDVFIGCNNTAAAVSPQTMAAVDYIQHDNVHVFGVGGSTTPVQSQLYIKSYKVWECAAWQTTMCHGTVQATSATTTSCFRCRRALARDSPHGDWNSGYLVRMSS
jgi:hypothetical protein